MPSLPLRRTDFHGLREVDGRQLKVYTISADGNPTDDELLKSAVDTASTVLPATAAAGDCGFVIVHRGEDAVWLLVHWWDGDILCQRLLRDGEDGFVPADPQLFACVWELHVIDHERRSWAVHALGAGDVDGYLGDTLTVPVGAELATS
ncbi:hypothetical protein FB384_000531 [Prauserella sediminis]|uniref:Uncharacterized protein n=1 Tax=Prauserella sediminis TaxID=577680 RepID=A0A839XGM8_9PSEU|nr:hypothetical protein [Prauserella sediminis]MBB3661627.1 hypothetical protein [Prauserella sediminis]